MIQPASSALTSIYSFTGLQDASDAISAFSKSNFKEGIDSLSASCFKLGGCALLALIGVAYFSSSNQPVPQEGSNVPSLTEKKVTPQNTWGLFSQTQDESARNVGHLSGKEVAHLNDWDKFEEMHLRGSDSMGYLSIISDWLGMDVSGPTKAALWYYRPTIQKTVRFKETVQVRTYVLDPLERLDKSMAFSKVNVLKPLSRAFVRGNKMLEGFIGKLAARQKQAALVLNNFSPTKVRMRG